MMVVGLTTVSQFFSCCYRRPFKILIMLSFNEFIGGNWHHDFVVFNSRILHLKLTRLNEVKNEIANVVLEI